MPGPVKHPCQAVIVRYSPDPASGELLNIGVVLLSPGHGFMASRFLDGWQRVTKAFPEADPVHLRRIASAIETASARHFGSTDQGVLLDKPSDQVETAFDAAIPREDAAIVRSHAIAGLTADPERTLRELFERYVAVRDIDERRVRRDDDAVWRSVRKRLEARNVASRLQSHTVTGPHEYQLDFDYGWQNGRWNVAKPLSFDLIDPSDIMNKATDWGGRITSLDSRAATIHLVVGMPPADASNEAKHAAEQAIKILRDKVDAYAEVVTEDDAESFADRIAKDILEHEAAE